MPGKLILLRHGESEWTLTNRFNGWFDTNITAHGHQQAIAAGQLIKDFDLIPNVAYTSVLSRAIQSCNTVLEQLNRSWIPTHRSWRLNERHYGALQGQNRVKVVDEVGKKQLMAWRRSYTGCPPPLDLDDPLSGTDDERYKHLPSDVLPHAESLEMVVKRIVPVWVDRIAKDLLEGKTVLVVAHSNSLRALVKHIGKIGDDEIVHLNIAIGTPFVYEFDQDLRPLKQMYYLDPAQGAAGADAVANQIKS